MFPKLASTFSTSLDLLKIVQFHLSDVGEGIKEVEVKQWFCQPGDEVIEFDPLCEVTSDKATVEVSSPFNGVVKEVHYKIGQTAKVGKPLVTFDLPEEGEKPKTKKEEKTSEKKVEKQITIPKKQNKTDDEETFNKEDFIDLYKVDDHKVDFKKYRDFEYKHVYSYDKSEIDVSKEKCLPKMNMLSAIANGLSCIMEKDPKTYVFGEDVAFGGVFRATDGLLQKFGNDRIFNAPLTEQGIVGFGIGMALDGKKPICEIQFADFIFTALDQIVSEASKIRYRNGGNYECGGLTVRCAMGAFGHGAVYHSQVAESFFAPAVGLKIVVPRNPVQAKGLLASCVDEPDPCMFFEHKMLYRMSVSDVPERYYKLPLGKAEVMKKGKDLTIVSWGATLYAAEKAAAIAEKEFGCSIEIIDLRTIVPYDEETLLKSVKKTGKCLIIHEGNYTGSFAGDIASFIQEKCFYHLDAPVARLCSMDTPIPLLHEKVVIPDDTKTFEMIKKLLQFQ